MTIAFSTMTDQHVTTAPTFQSMFFPAGEAHVKIINDNVDKGPLLEVARITGADANDLFTLAMWADACHRRADARHEKYPNDAPNRMILVMPYLPGARADHDDFIPFGAGVYADFINSLGVDQVICFDPHSRVLPSMLGGVTVIDSTRLIRQHVVGRADKDSRPQRYDGIIAPDKGAVDRASKVAAACHIPLYRAEKHRDPLTGKLSGFTCEALPGTGRFLVVDDICDGGGTFRGLAETTGLPPERLGLYVSHGVFSGAAASLNEDFSEIWTTDSFRTAEGYTAIANTGGIRVHVIPLEATLRGEFLR